MKDVNASHTHNFALVGHSGDGKTSLGEALLHQSGATQALGSVSAGTSVLNFLPEEKERQTTITSSVYAFDTDGLHFTMVDAPGDSNFQADGQVALHALDGAVLVVSADHGAKVGTDRMFRFCREHGIPLVCAINGVDRERADFEAAVASLEKMEAAPVVVSFPIGSAQSVSGVVDVLHMKAHGASGEMDIPSELADDAARAREKLVESVAECDDALLEKYLEKGELTQQETLHGLGAGTRNGRILPVFATAATREIGTSRLLWAAGHLLPSAAEHTFTDAEGHAVAPEADAPFRALVLKTIIDRYAGTLSVMRVVSGTLKPESTVRDATDDHKERLTKLMLLKGADHVDVPEAGPGDIIAVAKLKSVKTGHALVAEKGGTALPPIPIPQGVISYAISAKSKGDEDKVFTALGRLVEEDPTLHLGRDPMTGEFLLTGRGELHVRMTVSKLQRMFGVDVELKTPKVPYRETIKKRAENVEGKLKKQTGGKGMYGVCYLTVEPLPRGTGVEFVDEIVGGAIPRNLIPAVEKGIQEACVHGPLAGYPVVDVRVRCIDGKYHSVDSNEMAFKLAGSFGFKTALEQAGPTLLEPVMDLHVAVPAQYVGDVMGDLSSRRGRVGSSEAKGAMQVIQAQVPMSEMLEYASSLTSITAGQGEFHMEFHHYDEAPSHVRERVIAEAQASKTQH
ncbi:MAG TPA: elongation factor G [Myxococcota bacterium]|nr:elongation factor G [Myxococcota bacterium]